MISSKICLPIYRNLFVSVSGLHLPLDLINLFNIIEFYIII